MFESFRKYQRKIALVLVSLLTTSCISLACEACVSDMGEKEKHSMPSSDMPCHQNPADTQDQRNKNSHDPFCNGSCERANLDVRVELLLKSIPVFDEKIQFEEALYTFQTFNITPLIALGDQNNSPHDFYWVYSKPSDRFDILLN